MVCVQFQGPAAPGLRARCVLGPGRLGCVDQRGLGPSGAAPHTRALVHHGKTHAHLHLWPFMSFKCVSRTNVFCINRNGCLCWLLWLCCFHLIFEQTNISFPSDLERESHCSIKFLSSVYFCSRMFFITGYCVYIVPFRCNKLLNVQNNNLTNLTCRNNSID